jgi:hypothetical protein
MKNIHLIKTNKLSYVHYDTKEFFISPKPQLSKSINSIVTGYNVYITNDDYIGLSYYLDGDLVRKGVIDDKKYWEVRKDYKKIILTTDPDLIKDGVSDLRQNNEAFLEWFMQNTDIDYVKVTPLMSNNMRALFGYTVEYCTCKPGEPYNNTCCKIHGNIESYSLGNSKCSCMRYSPGCFTSRCANCGLPPNEKKPPVTFTWEEVKHIAEWSFNFYKRNDLNDEELEAEWVTLLNKMYEKKQLL